MKRHGQSKLTHHPGSASGNASRFGNFKLWAGAKEKPQWARSEVRVAGQEGGGVHPVWLSSFWQCLLSAPVCPG